ncbi:MAG: RecQ family ATP-dependent DNA helicase [Prevotella sp.]|nr:RecQ family ATP-dependent DNA helicase [Prevotella sp.]
MTDTCSAPHPPHLGDLYQKILKQYWGYDDFRGIQREIIESIGAGHDTLGLMPTGGGKSITFQVPALAKEGVCIVITPLIALMKDQVMNLRRRGIRAEAIHADLTHDNILRILENAVFGGVKVLYISPERLGSELFLKKLSHMHVCFVCVDEAHCISQWGYDFRPSYLAISSIREVLPDVPILALTATATPLVVQDIQDKLSVPSLQSHASKFNVFRMSFERQNLAYVVRHVNDKEQQMLHILNNVGGSAIVYTRSRRRTKEIATMLTAAGFSATFFHAGLDNVEKDRRQKAWQADEVRIMVATNAFGMGIDKPDVRVVIHADCPDSIEAYFQEAGRAGRDGQKAYAVLLFNGSDRQKLLKRIGDTFPEKDEIREVYNHLAYFYQVGVGSGYNHVFEFPIEKFCHAFHHFPTRVLSALKILNRAGYIEYHEEEDSMARVRFCLERDDLYRLRDNSPHEDAVIVCLLRNYSGLFNDYCYIDEAFLAEQTGLTRPQVYLALKELGQKRIVDFIPQKNTPHIRYMQRREDGDHLVFMPAVYDELKQRFSERIHKMIDYATCDNQCRSRMLLRYFGEESHRDCGHCDVCLEHREPDQEQLHDATQQVLDLLSDGQPHHVSILHTIKLPYPPIEKALQQLIDEELVTDDDGMLTAKRA